ncbi:MAG: DMT family transporter, partial [Alphaproteobacteria bacterium]
MASKPAETRLGIMLLFVLAFGWGFNWPMMRIVLHEIPLWQFRAVTGIASGLILLALARAMGKALAVPRRHWWTLVVMSLFNVTSWFVLIAWGIKMMATGQASILGFTMPIFAAILSVLFLHERLGWRVILSLVFGTAGIAVLVLQDFTAAGFNPWGAAIILLAAFNWGVGSLIQKRTRWVNDPTVVAGWQLFVGCVPIAVISAVTEKFVYHQADLTIIGASMYVTFVSLVLCYFAWFRIVVIFPIAISSIGTLLTPAVG